MKEETSEKGNLLEESKNDEMSEQKAPKDDIPKIDLQKFFDIVGQIDIILRHDASLRISVAPCPFDSVPAGDFKLTTINELPMMFSVFTAGDNLVPWIQTNFPRIGNFSNFDEYLRQIWGVVWTKVEASMRILICPPSNMWTQRMPDATRIGYPTNLVLGSNAMTFSLVSTMVANINYRDFSPTLAQVTVCGDPTILAASNSLITYSENTVPAIRDAAQRMINYASGNTSSRTVLPLNSLTNHYNPLCDFRLCANMYKGLLFYVRLAYELTTKAISPVIPITPINDSVIIKQGQASATRSGFLSDVVSTQYNPSMLPDFATIVSTFLTPGYVQVEIDWSDCPAEATDFLGFISILSKLIFMHSNTPLDSITSESARQVEERIVTLGLRARLFDRATNRAQGAYPLDDVQVVPRTINPNVLDGLRTDLAGRGWMNSNRQVRANDGIDGWYATEMEHRPVYAVDCSDYDQYEGNPNYILGQWDIYRAIEGFAYGWGRRNSALSEILLMYAVNIFEFIIRMNEYLRLNFYTGLRLPGDMVRGLNGETKNKNCLVVPIKARSILAFAKSVGHISPYVRQTPILQQITVESQITKSAVLLRLAYRLIMQEINYYEVDDEYGRGRIWSEAARMASVVGLSPLLHHFNCVAERGLISNISRIYAISFEDANIYTQVLAPILRNVMLDPTDFGLMRTFLYQRDYFNMRSIEFLRRLAAEGSIYINARAHPPEPEVTIQANLRAWLREYAARYRLDTLSLKKIIRIKLPLSFEIVNEPRLESSFPLEFRYPETNRRISESIIFRPAQFGMLHLTNNEIRQPDTIVNLAGSLEPLAIDQFVMNRVVMRLQDFVAAIGRYSVRTLVFRDSSARFTDVLSFAVAQG